MSYRNNKKLFNDSIIGTVLSVIAALFIGKYFVDPTGLKSVTLDYDDLIDRNRPSETVQDNQKERRIGDTQEYFEFKTRQNAIDHFNKHRSEFNYQSVDEYVEGANRVINNPNALYKTEKEDGDYIYYLQTTKEIVFISRIKDYRNRHFIRTYFRPSSGLEYFQRQ